MSIRDRIQPWLNFQVTDVDVATYLNSYIDPEWLKLSDDMLCNKLQGTEGWLNLLKSQSRAVELHALACKYLAVIRQHDLCHDLHGKVGAKEFAAGCAQEQRKEYGHAPDADMVRWLQLLSHDEDDARLGRAVKKLLRTS